MNHISYYYQQLSDRDKYSHNSHVWYYKRGSIRDKQHYFCISIKEALTTKYTYRAVLKLIDM
ncbi:hypothetical protein [Salmonella phage SD-6_S16]|nr:hypothetical protein [Salmonella phage SD-6_S16]WPK20876.1 hypothetical protein [Salmonella phage SD-15_S21]